MQSKTEVVAERPILDKAQSPLRWLVLILGCVIMIANYYCYDNPAALKTQIGDYMGDPSDYETMFSLLYTGKICCCVSRFFFAYYS